MMAPLAPRTTAYRVRLPEGSELVRPGQRHPGIDRHLRRARSDSWSIIAAYEAVAGRLPPSESVERQRALAAHCQRHGLAWLPARSGCRLGPWGWDDGCFVLGVTRSAAVGLGRRFGQRAILFGSCGGRAVMLGCEWPGGKAVP